MTTTISRQQINAGILYADISRTGEAAGVPLSFRLPDSDDPVCQLPHYATAAEWRLREHSQETLLEGKLMAMRAKKRGFGNPDAISRQYAEQLASQLEAQHRLLNLLERKPELAADVQQVYAGTIAKLRRNGPGFIHLMTPQLVEDAMRKLAAEAAMPIANIDESSPSAAAAALQTFRLAAGKMSGAIVEFNRYAARTGAGRVDVGYRLGMVKFIAECIALAAASIYLINRIAAR